MDAKKTGIIFYFDPSCPFCWITGRWLEIVSKERNVKTTWRPFSLALKNNELDSGENDDATPHGAIHRQAHRVLRVIEAAEQAGADVGPLYRSFGYNHFVKKQPYNNEVIHSVLSTHDLDKKLVEEADNTSHDVKLKASLQSALAVVGDDVGVPIIVLSDDSQEPIGFFGPVLQKLPDSKTALALWDGLITLGVNKDFYELKRTRPSDGPDVNSTARLFE